MHYFLINFYYDFIIFNPLASPCAGAPALKYGYVNTVITSPGEVKGLISINYIIIILNYGLNYYNFLYKI